MLNAHVAVARVSRSQNALIVPCSDAASHYQPEEPRQAPIRLVLRFRTSTNQTSDTRRLRCNDLSCARKAEISLSKSRGDRNFEKRRTGENLKKGHGENPHQVLQPHRHVPNEPGQWVHNVGARVSKRGRLWKTHLFQVRKHWGFSKMGSEILSQNRIYRCSPLRVT